MKQAIHPFWIANGIFLLCLAVIGRTQAQNVPVPDATLPVNSVVTSEDNISTITGGTVAGSNLFHSFEKFNIDEGQIADFVSPSAAIQNILARVTGGSSSKIMGILGTSGLSNPNLFLINPNGIVFGPNASLEVGGSFVATTANAIEFGDRGFFSASAPNHPGLLTVNPSAFLFNQIAAQPINSIEIGNGAFISAGSLEKPGSLLLVGGNVSPSIAETGKILIDGGILQAPGGRVELGGVAGAGTVGLNVDSNNLRLSFPVVGRRADVSITNGAFVNVVGGGGGSITISAQNLDVLEGSELVAGIESGLQSVGSKAGDITLDVIEAMTIANSFISSDVDSEAMGNTGGINIKAGSLSLTDGAELSASTFGQGEAGGIFVQANNSVSIAGSYIYSDVGFEAVGNTGGINIKAGSLSFTNAQLSARISGQGDAGGIFMQANNSISIARESRIITGLEKTVVGNAGDIHIQAGSLSLTDRTELLSSTSGEGRAGNVIIDAQDTVSLENSFISSETFGPGNGGIIDIKARSLSLTEGTELLSRTTGEGAAGTIEINASDSVSISGVNLKEGFSSGLITVSEEEDSGQGGDISVTTGIRDRLRKLAVCQEG